VVVDPYQTLWTGSQLLIDKPREWTSFDVVNKVRLALQIREPKKIRIKVGHAGTLDPLATGLLILCTGSFTKKIDALQGLEKTYSGVIRLGATTPSYDAETEVDREFDISGITEDAIRETAGTFLGSSEQFPPAHSAVKLEGRRAYHMARAGEEMEMKSRKIEILRFEIGKIDMADVHFEVDCSKGTYIRSLAYDFGKRLQNGAYLAELNRTAIGPYQLRDAWQLTDLIDFINSHRDLYIENFVKRD
jgi:tRNA pseudouridine55 synthase